ncbi:uncharacterized protein LOC111064986 [Drosophila obscura]|uniref:uncharacterized protein LOC111064986 n=1 Tax=Drosophila obscura TaxID=7282 RepID=UPI000BA15247|nr:uncharacterized protein LOC111064986 [Drosophila obscura]
MPVNIFYLSILLVAVIATLTAGHAVEREQPSALGYGPAVHISSGVLQLADDTETQLLLVPSVHSSPLAQPWPHFYVEGLTSHLPHVATLPQPTVHEPRIVISDNLDFSHHPSVKSHGR